MATTKPAIVPGAIERPIGAIWPAYLLLGVCFGIVLALAEVVSWFRMQEMFRFQSPRMYLIIGSAVLTAAASVRLIGWLGITTVSGDPIVIPPKAMGRGIRYVAGGIVFGIGWALNGACPGPLFALLGSGMTVMIVVIAAALLGTWVYGLLRPRLPH
jgi:uncharacterized membrane protein YedE/YeeE